MNIYNYSTIHVLHKIYFKNSLCKAMYFYMYLYVIFLYYQIMSCWSETMVTYMLITFLGCLRWLITVGPWGRRWVVSLRLSTLSTSQGPQVWCFSNCLLSSLALLWHLVRLHQVKLSVLELHPNCLGLCWLMGLCSWIAISNSAHMIRFQGYWWKIGATLSYWVQMGDYEINNLPPCSTHAISCHLGVSQLGVYMHTSWFAFF